MSGLAAAVTRFAVADRSGRTGMTLKQASEAIRARNISSVDLTRARLERPRKLQPESP